MSDWSLVSSLAVIFRCNVRRACIVWALGLAGTGGGGLELIGAVEGTFDGSSGSGLELSDASADGLPSKPSDSARGCMASNDVSFDASGGGGEELPGAVVSRTSADGWAKRPAQAAAGFAAAGTAVAIGLDDAVAAWPAELEPCPVLANARLLSEAATAAANPPGPPAQSATGARATRGSSGSDELVI